MASVRRFHGHFHRYTLDCAASLDRHSYNHAASALIAVVAAGRRCTEMGQIRALICDLLSEMWLDDSESLMKSLGNSHQYKTARACLVVIWRY